MANRFTWTGHAFSGWARSPGGQVAYADGAVVVNLAETQDEVVTLYAVWSGSAYNVRFDSNGGTGVMDNQTIQIGETRNLHANTFSYAGREFLGWALTSSGTVAYGDGDPVYNLSTTSGATVSLYAVWSTANSTCNVAFDANGGSVSPLLWPVARGGILYALPLPTRPGFTFDGWWTQAVGGTAVEVPITVISDMTLHAHWIDNIIVYPPAATTYKVVFNANGGTGKMAAQTMTYGKAATLGANKYNRNGYVFIGWATKKGGAVEYKNAQSVKNLTAKGGTTTLYAVWAKKTYKVAFYGTYKGVTGKMKTQTFTYGKAKKLTANKFKRNGYAFKGWAKSKALAKKGKVAYKNKQSVKNLVTTGKTVKLYAVWKKK